jgi:Ca-activated chloride channel homolog
LESQLKCVSTPSSRGEPYSCTLQNKVRWKYVGSHNLIRTKRQRLPDYRVSVFVGNFPSLSVIIKNGIYDNTPAHPFRGPGMFAQFTRWSAYGLLLGSCIALVGCGTNAPPGPVKPNQARAEAAADNQDLGVDADLPTVSDATKPFIARGKPAPMRKTVPAENELGLQQPATKGKSTSGYVPLGVDDFNHFVDNEYKPVKQDPLSTFSVDVNTASYSMARRMLGAGQKPPKDAIRLAEWINYFPYSYAGPTDDRPVAFDLEIGQCHWQPKHLIARIGLKAKQIDPKNTPARNLVFLIDTSGSMSGETRLPLVQKSLNLLIDRLTAKDLVTIVTYAGDSTLKLPPTSGEMKAKIRDVVNNLHAGGGTNGGGIQMAYQKARQSYLENGANRVILCTDGDFNIGISDQGSLVRLIEEERKGNVFLTVLGFGMGNLKDNTLEKLANHGNGHYAYIDTESEAFKVFVEQGAALVTVAKDVKLQIEFNPAQVSAYRLLGYENRLLKNEDFRNDAKDAGDMGSGHSVTALYEIVPVGVKLELPGVDPLKYQQTDAKLTPAAKSGEWFTVKMRYKHPLAATSLEVAKSLPAGSEKQRETNDFRFVLAVAELAMLLRDSPYKGVASFDSVIETAEANLGDDPAKHRAEFVAMARQARRIYMGEVNRAGKP